MSAYFDLAAWDAAANPALTLSAFAGRPLVVSIEAPSTIHMAAVELVVKLAPERWARFGRYYLPRRTATRSLGDIYRAWVEQGRFTVTDGDYTDLPRIAADLAELATMFPRLRVVLPAWGGMAGYGPAAFWQAGIACQTLELTADVAALWMPRLAHLIRAGSIEHDGDPVFRWMLGNVVVRPDIQGRVYPGNASSGERITGAVALLNAMAITGGLGR